MCVDIYSFYYCYLNCSHYHHQHYYFCFCPLLEIAYISSRGRGGEYASRPKSLPGGGAQPGLEVAQTPAGAKWAEDARKDTTGGRPHRSRSRSRGTAHWYCLNVNKPHTGRRKMYRYQTNVK